MLSGDLSRTAAVALGEGEDGLRAIGFELFRPVLPMLASPAESVAEAVESFELASVEWKLDGIRIQIHRRGDEVRIYTRNLNDITAALPGIADAVRRAARSSRRCSTARRSGWARTGRRRSRTRSRAIDGQAPEGTTMFLFDVLHLDGDDLLDAPLARARRAGSMRSRGDMRIPRVVTSDPAEGERVLEEALAAGHEGVVVKDAASPYVAGRRGKAWRKVKPVRTYDLVVLGAEWGHGRRQGRLSNLHLGARDPDGGFVMVGKTFKGMTDELLEWQTAALLEREVERRGIAVLVRPELVIEIALDGVQASTRYPGGVALRFARVKRYRPDKDAAEADTIESLQALLPARA